MSRIYVASSWRNAHQPGVVAALREAGWACGAGKPTSIFIPERIEPELMYLLAGIPCTTIAEVLHFHGGGR